MTDSGGNGGHRIGDPIIVCDGVKKWFGDFQALSGVTTSVGEREVVVVIGPSGSGKSTLIRCINRLERHDRGSIVVDGVELSDDIRNIQEIRRETGMVFQSFNLFPHLTVLDNITLAPRNVRNAPKAEAEATAMELLERVKIPEQARKYPGQLSGGQLRANETKNTITAMIAQNRRASSSQVDGRAGSPFSPPVAKIGLGPANDLERDLGVAFGELVQAQRFEPGIGESGQGRIDQLVKSGDLAGQREPAADDSGHRPEQAPPSIGGRRRRELVGI